MARCERKCEMSPPKAEKGGEEVGGAGAGAAEAAGLGMVCLPRSGQWACEHKRGWRGPWDFYFRTNFRRH